MSETVEWLAGINAILGAWLIAVPFVFTGAAELWTGFAFWNYVLVGGAILVLSGYNWWVAGEDDPGSEAAAAGSAILGLWMIVLPFVTEIGADGLLLWNDVIVGAIVAILGGYNAWRAWNEDTEVEAAAT